MSTAGCVIRDNRLTCGRCRQRLDKSHFHKHASGKSWSKVCNECRTQPPMAKGTIRERKFEARKWERHPLEWVMWKWARGMFE